MRRWICTLFAVLLLPIFFSPMALAQDSPAGGAPGTFGLRAGLGLDPDQFVVGASFAIGKRLSVMRIVPSVDIGFGSGTSILFNADLLFSLKVEETRFRLYGGGGPAVSYFDHEGGGSNWDLGLYLVAGTELPLLKSNPTGIELRFGITNNVPDFRALLTIGF